MPLTSRFLAEKTGLDLKMLKEDLTVLGGLGTEQLAATRNFLAEGQNLLKRDEVLGDQIQALCEASDVTPLQFAAARNVSKLCMFAQLEQDENVDTFLSGLEAIGAFEDLEEDIAAKVRGFLTGLRDSLAFVARIRSRDRQLSSSMPALTGIGFSTNLRVVLRREFRPLRDEAASYEPAIEEFVPVGIVQLRTDSKQTEISFQMDQDDLEKLLDSLLALKKELEAAAASLSQKGISVPDVRTD